MTQAQALQKLLDAPGIIPMPGVFDPISTRIAERAGFEAAFMSGFNVAAARIGMPDTGLISYTEMLDQGRNLARSEERFAPYQPQQVGYLVGRGVEF